MKSLSISIYHITWHVELGWEMLKEFSDFFLIFLKKIIEM